MRLPWAPKLVDGVINSLTAHTVEHDSCEIQYVGGVWLGGLSRWVVAVGQLSPLTMFGISSDTLGAVRSVCFVGVLLDCLSDIVTPLSPYLHRQLEAFGQALDLVCWSYLVLPGLTWPYRTLPSIRASA